MVIDVLSPDTERNLTMLNRDYPIRTYHNTSAADLIKETMEYYGLTINDLAGKLDVQPTDLSKILDRSAYLDTDIAKQFEALFNISSELLFKPR